MQTDVEEPKGSGVGSMELLDIRDVPSLCSNDDCEGCGELKTYRGKPASSLVCCNQCWKKLPKWMRDAFVNGDDKRPEGGSSHGATIWENRIAVTLTWLRMSNDDISERGPLT
jgi:hypothetical protein